MKTLVVNFFAGPGAGKSTLAAGLFAELKSRGVNCELVTEYAKDKVWEESFGVFRDQLYVFAKQAHKIRRVLGKVDVVVTDSPLLLSLHYGAKEQDIFEDTWWDLVMIEHSRVPSLNVFLRRVKKYEPSGRTQTEDKAKEIDQQILDLLAGNRVPHIQMLGGLGVVPELADKVQGMIRSG